MPSGYLLINKPVDWTSHDVVAYLRTVTGVKTIGHAGTLDPFATGLLIVGVGREATKQLDQFKNMPKTYTATVQLGATSDTYDRTGKIETTTHDTDNITQKSDMTHNTKNITQVRIEQILSLFIGKQKQLPPMYSAKKVGGKKLYELARKGIDIARQPHEIEIYDIKLIDWSIIHCQLSIVIHCSSGTYIRTLAHDIGQKLGCGAYCESLERTAIGTYSASGAFDPKTTTKDNWQSKLLPLSTANS